MALGACRTPASLLSSALDKTILESIKSVSLVHTFPFFPLSAQSRAAMQRRGDLVPSALSNCKYLVTFSTNTSAPREQQLIFLISVCEDNTSTLCYSYIVKGKLGVISPHLLFK